MQSKHAEVRIINTQTLSDDWYTLKKYTFALQRQNGEWQQQNR
ncbi:MAG: GDP-mannose pyrophosphatase, partial [Enterobacteriaceae bacterium]|nr:GDP-mannose pyrophosphatase [Enterobacteriaceae bacterium]